MMCLLPKEGTRPKFAHLYIFNTKNEIRNRIDVVWSGNQSNDLGSAIIASLKDMIDGRTIFLTQVKIAGFIVGNFDTQECVRDIVVETRSNNLQRISEDGYRDDISLRESSFADNRKWRNKLFQQFCVDGFSMVESQRLNFIRFNQDQLRVDMYKGSFTAGPRYIFNNFVDALKICNWVGFPTLFIAITCNPQWPEIQRVLKDTNLRPEDRPDILCRVFKMKLDSMMTESQKGCIFGRIRAYMYQLVEKYMIHGPCGQANLKSPCMKDRVCTKRFPKSVVQGTESDADGFTVYRRMEAGRTVTKKKTTFHNGFVVPYNRIWLSKYRCHINIELCNQNKSIKYMFKYVNKGHDRVTAAFYETRNTDGGVEIRDEIKMYYDCRYLSAYPSIIRLSFHLPDHQPLVFNEKQSLQSVLYRPPVKQTMFLAWFEANMNYPHTRDLRLANVPPGKGEDYYLKFLLNIHRGYTCYEDIRKVFDTVYPTFRDAYYVLGLFDDDKEYRDAIIEVNTWALGDYIRRLFVVMLLSNSLSRPDHNYSLTEIEKILQSNGKSLRNYAPMRVPIEFSAEDTINILVLDELDYDRFEMGRELQRLRSKGEIVINVPSSGIASLLLPGGRTTHSRFRLPINVHESITCSISQQSPHAELLIRAKLIIWDEAHMMRRDCFEALDKTMKLILQVDKLFGGKGVVLGGDFRQILQVVLKASRQDIVYATINSSPLWDFCRVMKLTKNMRLLSCSSPSNVDEVGNEDDGEQNDGEATIEISDDMLIGDSDDPFRDLLEFIYPDLLSNMCDPNYFHVREILAPTNEFVESVNDHLMSLLPGGEKVYLSSDSICSGLRSHALKYKVGAPVMVIRNIDQARGSCKILSGKNIGDMVFIPRMTLIPSNSGLPIKFKRRQFPLIVSFAMTINKIMSRGGIKIFIKSDSGELTNVTRNVVYKEVFHRI
ncbi:hypothetical protein ABFS83_02G106300 [Erythranthe nasuta]